MHPALILSRSLRSAGETTLGLERGAQAGRFVRVRPGAYVAVTAWASLDDEARHRVAMDAYAATARREVVFAVESAAALLGIPVVGPWPAAPRVVAFPDASRRVRVGVSPRWRPVGPHEVARRGGTACTAEVRTAIDLAAERDLPSGVAALDHVIRAGHPVVEIRAAVAAARPFHGARKVDAALAMANGRAESPLESLSLARLAELGFPRPQQQVGFTIAGQSYRVDFLWPELGLVGEADGRVKYDADALWREKRREDDIRSAMSGFVRWSWADAWAGEPLARRLERAGLRRNPRFASHHAFRT